MDVEDDDDDGVTAGADIAAVSLLTTWTAMVFFYYSCWGRLFVLLLPRLLAFIWFGRVGRWSYLGSLVRQSKKARWR